MKKIIYILVLNFIVGSIFAQLPGSGISVESNVLDGVYIHGVRYHIVRGALDTVQGSHGVGGILK